MRFIVVCKELGQDFERDGRKIHAHDHFEAATKWAEDEDLKSAEYWIVGGNDATLEVTAVNHNYERSGPTIEIIVTGESVPVYTARMKR